MAKRIRQTPHVFVLIFFLVLLASILTYVIPSGEFERVEDNVTGKTIVVADSYSMLDNSPVAIWKIPMKFYEALIDKSTVQLIFFIFLIGGSFEIIMQTGSITSFFENILLMFKSKTIFIIPIFVCLFSILGFTMGLTTASIIFVPIGIVAAQMLGYGKITGAAMVALAVNAGFAAGIYNPFTVGIAQTIAEVPLYSGAWIRWILLICMLVSTTGYIIFYANKYDRLSIKDIKNASDTELKIKKLVIKEKLVLIIFFLAFVIVTYGIQAWKWKTGDIAVLFLVTGIICGLVYGFGINRICDIFVQGCQKMVKGIFVIGLAATMRLILADGNILDTIAYYLVGIANNFPQWAKLLGMFYGNTVLDLLITSGSTQAAIVMPIMVPMADCLGISRQAAVLAFQLGDGLINLSVPLSTTLTGIMAVADITYD